MQVCEQHLPAPQQLAFAGERLLDFHDEFGAPVHGGGIGNDFSSRSTIIAIRQTGAEPGAGFDQHRVTIFGKLADRGWDDTDPIFVVLDLLGHAHKHHNPLRWSLFSARHMPRMLPIETVHASDQHWRSPADAKYLLKKQII